MFQVESYDRHGFSSMAALPWMLEAQSEGESHRCHCGVTVRCGVLKPAEPQAAFPDGRVQITVESTKRTFFLLN